MGYLIPLKEKFAALIVDVPAIKTFIFDDLSAINGDSQADYQLLLLKPPIGESAKEDRSLEYTFCDIDMFIFTPELSDDPDHWTLLYDECHASMITFLRALFLCAPNYVLNGSVKITPGHMQHNAKLIGARAQFKLRIHNGC